MTKGTLVCSSRHLNTILGLDRTSQTDQILWKLSGKDDEFDLTEEQKTSSQHYVTIDGDTIRAFDNHNITGETRVVSYKIDWDNMVLADDGFRSYRIDGKFPSACGAQQLISGEMFMLGWGRTESDYVRREDLLGYGLAEESDLAEDGSRVTLMRLDSIKTGTEKTITVEVPEIGLPKKKANRLVVTVTCVTMSRVEHRYGEDCVRTNVVPYCKNAEGASPANIKVWSPAHKRVFLMKKMEDKDWKIRLECKSRDEEEEDVEYALVVSIWDPKGNDICARIRNTNRYPEMVSVREMVRMTERMRAEKRRLSKA